jgi:NitT/TauT family transport system substrate-binding protein
MMTMSAIEVGGADVSGKVLIGDWWQRSLVATLCVFAFALSHNIDAGAAELRTIRFGMTPKSFVESAQIIANQKGIFEKNGLKVELVELSGDVLILRALLSGDLDIATVGSYVVINAVQKGAPIRAFVTPVPEQPHMLVATKAVSTWTDLVGKNFAVSQPGAISHTFPRVILSKLGGDPDKVNWLAIGGNSARQKALVTGVVDATLLHKERALQVARSDSRFHIIGSTGDYLKGVPLVWHTAKTEWLAANGDVARRFTKSIIEAVRFAIQNKEAMLKLGEELIGKDPVSVEAAYDAYRDSRVWGINGGLDKKDFDFTVRLGIETGEMKEPIVFEKVVDTKFVDAVINELGRK